ncbi:hypothetical protein M5X02_32290 [Paenibacillus alvei]|uniref:hypothetical protein n=1 Tax=Paenibacillus alvei TaxID=44250 RepID=UPI00228496D5|nr:hypothetical protein [Paenibacillus alvei]MCY9545309.1 hypothetical protein [Paenibacillus alvei]MEC0082812.1 hypothetical protein [Paenibacillus alvei]
MYVYDVEIKLIGKREAFVTVTQREMDVSSNGSMIEGFPKLGVQRRAYVTALFRNIETKAEKCADKIVRKWRKKETTKSISYRCL